MLQWNILVRKTTRGGLKGKSGGKLRINLKCPPAYGDSTGPRIVACQRNKSSGFTGPALRQCAGGLFSISTISFCIRFSAIYEIIS